MSNGHEILSIDIYNRYKKGLPTFMIAFKLPYFYWVIYIIKGISAVIEC